MDDYKYLAIVEWVKKYIKLQGLKPNDRFLTEKELCEIHGVSRQTVRQALMRLESDNVISRVRGSGTFVKGVVPDEPKKLKTVGVISTYFSDYIFPYIVTGIESVLGNAGYSMQLSITHNQVFEETQALKSMISNGIEGLIVEPSKSALPNPNTELYQQIKARGIPLVFFNAKYPWADFPYVAMDDEAAGRKVTDHLFECGHSRISGIFTLDDIQGHKRYSGFMNSCIAHENTSAENNVLWYSAAERHSIFKDSKGRLFELLENSSAIVCYNDQLAVEILQFCKENGIKVPTDVSIVGIDDSKYASICDVPLTTVRHPHRRLGEQAAKMLLELIDTYPTAHENMLFTPELIVRDSVKTVGKAVAKAAL